MRSFHVERNNYHFKCIHPLCFQICSFAERKDLRNVEPGEKEDSSIRCSLLFTWCTDNEYSTAWFSSQSAVNVENRRPFQRPKSSRTEIPSPRKKIYCVNEAFRENGSVLIKIMRKQKWLVRLIKVITFRLPQFLSSCVGLLSFWVCFALTSETAFCCTLSIFKFILF